MGMTLGDLIQWGEEREATVVELIEVMAKDPELSREVIGNPHEIQKAFRLSDQAVEAIANLRIDDFEVIGRVEDPRSFAKGAVAVGKVGLGAKFDPKADICYYGG